MVGRFFLLFLVFTFQAFALEMKIPHFLTGLKPDKGVKKAGDFYIYDVEGKTGPISITEAKTSNKTIEELVGSLQYSYKTNDQALFKSLFTPEAMKMISSMPKEAFEQRWNASKARKDVYIDFYYKHEKGFLVGIRSTKDTAFNLQYVVQRGNSWLFDEFEMNFENPKTNNIGLWFTYQPLSFEKASLLQSFSMKDTKRILEAQVKLPTITIFKKTKERWEFLGQIKDNDDKYSSFPDLNKAVGMIRIDVSANFEVQMGDEILVMESNFPMNFFPLSLMAQGQLQLK